MAIQRCPYCKAIIDEGTEYCTNCGTKLLFPEDEFIEEEIPGEKIIDVNDDVKGTQQEDVNEPEPDAEGPVAEDDKPGTGAEEPAEESTEEVPLDAKPAEKRKSPRKRAPRKKAKEEPVTIIEDEDEPVSEQEAEIEAVEPSDELPIEPEEITVDEPSPEESIQSSTDDLPDGFAEKIDEAAEKVGDPLEEFLSEQAQEEESAYKEITEADLTPQPGTEDEKEWKTPPPDDEELKEPEDQEDITIQTGDLEEIVDDAEKEKEEIDDFVASIKKERQSVREDQSSDTQDMPPWADSVQDGPLPEIPPTDEIILQDDSSEVPDPPIVDSPPIDEAQEIEQAYEPPASSEDDEITPTPGYDTRSAFPETVDQQGLPFIGKGDESDTAEQTAYDPQAVETEAKKTAQPVGFGDWIKARIFDVVFVTALWFVALWIASQVLESSVFLLISGSAPVILIFLAVLLFIYFFFFLFFLGETLGNYLFSSDE